MSSGRNLTSWLLLGLLTVVGAGAAVLGVVQSPKNVALNKAVTNTLNAPNYTQVLTETTPQGKQAEYLTFQAPDRLGGYIQSGDKRTYVFVIGNVEYQSLTVSSKNPPKHLVFYKQTSPSAKSVDPVHGYLPYGKQAKKVEQSGGTHSFSLTKGGQTGKFVFTVSGQYVSSVSLNVATTSIDLVISQVGTSPPVKLPPGSKVVVSPAGASSSASK